MTSDNALRPESDSAAENAAATGSASPKPVGPAGGPAPEGHEVASALKGQARAALEQGDLAWATRDLTLADIEPLQLIENLRIYQAELEIQNEELRAAQLDTERAVQRYLRLFSDMPIAGLVIDRIGRILEINRVAGDLFGLNTRHLRDHYLTRLTDRSGEVAGHHLILLRLHDEEKGQIGHQSSSSSAWRSPGRSGRRLPPRRSLNSSRRAAMALASGRRGRKDLVT